MYSLGTIPREHFHRYAERQLLAVRRRVPDVIDGLGVPATRGGGRADGEAARRLPQGHPRLSGDWRRDHNDRNPKSSLALHVPPDVLAETRRNVEQGVHDPQPNKNLHARAPRDDDGLAAVVFCIANVV